MSARRVRSTLADATWSDLTARKAVDRLHGLVSSLFTGSAATGVRAGSWGLARAWLDLMLWVLRALQAPMGALHPSKEAISGHNPCDALDGRQELHSKLWIKNEEQVPSICESKM